MLFFVYKLHTFSAISSSESERLEFILPVLVGFLSSGVNPVWLNPCGRFLPETIGIGVTGLLGEDPSSTTSLYAIDDPEAGPAPEVDVDGTSAPFGVDVNILFMRSLSRLDLAADFDFDFDSP